MKKTIVGFICVLLFTITTLANEAVDEIQNCSVTIKSGMSEGSGTIVSREIFKTNKKKEKVIINFIVTAGHVVDDLRNVRTVIKDGKDYKIIEFKNASMVREEIQDGRRVGESKMDCKVIAYSNSDHGDDLALLMIVKHGYKDLDTNANFYLNDNLIKVGSQLWHCGSLLGQMGANSMTAGIMSQIGRIYQGKVYDQTTVTAFPGSSGGGVFLIKDNEPLYMGMVVRGSGETFNLIVPIRRILDFAKRRNLEWIFDKSHKTPTLEEIEQIPIEEDKTIIDQKPTLAPKANSLIFLDGQHAKYCTWYVGPIPTYLPQRDQ